ncbi:MAG: hypothetical protein AAGF79_15365 [Pseudomonadota bacterium]
MTELDRPLSFIANEIQYRPRLRKQGPIARVLTRMLLNYEDRQGRTKVLPNYLAWQKAMEAGETRPFSSFLEKTNVTLEVNDPSDYLKRQHSGPTVVIANHMFGLHDAFLVCGPLEATGREPRLVAALNAFAAMPEFKKYLFEVDARQPPLIKDQNEISKKNAMDWLGAGNVVFMAPSGRVASAKKRGAVPTEYPWKTFAARLVMAHKATVLPVFVHGNSGDFASVLPSGRRIGAGLAALKMFYQYQGASFRVSFGKERRFEDFQNTEDRYKLTAEMRDMVFALSDGVDAGDTDPGVQVP